MKPMLGISGVGMTFATRRGPFCALRDINLSVQRGEFVALIGHSGCGKSTLLNLVAGLTTPTEGVLLLDDRELKGPGPDRGVVFQNHSLLPWLSCQDNVLLAVERVFGGKEGKAQLKARALAALELVGLAHAKDKHPHEISGGMKQRVGIARALASRPKVLLSDEATSALDPETTRSILDLLRQVNRELGVTVVLITHQMQVIKQIADRVAVIEAGRIVEMGPVIDVFTKPQQDITKSLIDEIVQIYQNYDFKTQVLAASLRTSLHVIEAAKAGADIGTMPFKVLDQMFNHPLTDKGLEQFLKDYAKVFQEAPAAR